MNTIGERSHSDHENKGEKLEDGNNNAHDTRHRGIKSVVYKHKVVDQVSKVGQSV